MAALAHKINGKPKIGVLVQGLFEKSDSIGYDAVYQYNALSMMYPEYDVSIYAENFRSDIYGSIVIDDIEDIFSGRVKLDLIIYHFCDGWPKLEEWLKLFGGKIVVRWHNNTPPWFYLKQRHFASRTVDGYKSIIALANLRDDISFWVNSDFSADQLQKLVVQRLNLSVVYPASRYISSSIADNPAKRPTESKKPAERPVNLLFVGRLVAHKGHRHIIHVASIVSRLLTRNVRVQLPGRLLVGEDEYAAELLTLGDSMGVEVLLPGEVSEHELRQLYAAADAFVCLSEHEGFGLPVFEAMRCKVPVVAWACAALEELLIEHPLSTSEFRPEFFAAGIAAVVSDLECRDEILLHQSKVLEKYSAKVVNDQIRAAFALVSSANNIGAVEALPYDASILDEMVFRAKAVAGRYNYDSPFDFSGNYVSRYDIESTASYLQNIEDAENGVILQYLRGPDCPSMPGLWVAGARFHGHGITKGYAGASAEIENGFSGYLFYGPYLKLPKGAYVVELRASFEVGCFDELVVDAASTDGVLSERAISVTDLNAGTICLGFCLKTDSVDIEFRVRGICRRSGSVLLHGAVVTQISEEPDEGALDSDVLETISAAHLRLQLLKMYTADSVNKIAANLLRKKMEERDRFERDLVHAQEQLSAVVLELERDHATIQSMNESLQSAWQELSIKQSQLEDSVSDSAAKTKSLETEIARSELLTARLEELEEQLAARNRSPKFGLLAIGKSSKDAFSRKDVT